MALWQQVNLGELIPQEMRLPVEAGPVFPGLTTREEAAAWLARKILSREAITDPREWEWFLVEVMQRLWVKDPPLAYLRERAQRLYQVQPLALRELVTNLPQAAAMADAVVWF
jgi:hypothetical protein